MKKLFCTLLAAALFLLPLTGCGKKDDNLIRLNEVTHSIFYAPLYLAMSLGYFEDEGLTVELTNGGGADKSMAAVLSGDADIGLMGPEAAIYVLTGGRQDSVQIIGQLTKRDGSFLMSRIDEPDFDYSSITGKEVIAGRRGGVPAMVLEYVLRQKGLIDGENITLNYDVQFNMTSSAFLGGVGDYVTMFEPTASEVVREGRGYIVASIGQSSGEVPYTAFMATKSYLANNGEKVQKFLNAVYKAMLYVQTGDDAEMAELLREHFPGTADQSLIDSLASYKRIDAWMTDPVMKEESLNRLQMIMTEAGELDAPVAYADLVNNTFAEQAIASVTL